MKSTVMCAAGKHVAGVGLAAGTFALTLMAHSAGTSVQAPPSKLQAILTKCATCHNPDQRAGGLDLTSQKTALEHGRALVPGNVDGSAIAQQVVHGAMPPGNPLSDSDREIVVEWIKSGAAYPTITRPSKPLNPKSWAFKPLLLPAVPSANRLVSTNPIDAFIWSGLQAKGLKPAVEASKNTLIRRVTIDVAGLPPSPADVASFLADTKPGAYERLVDRLLASPQYGERYGRFWLDIARFGESHGYEYDNLRDNAWPYRDYVVRAFNDDVPYDRFLTEQLAGDASSPAVPAATGFLVGGPMDEAGKAAAGLQVRLRAREEELEDMVGTVAQTCIGLTVNCARCHDHKFDPIPQVDYFQMKAALTGVAPGERPLPSTQPPPAGDNTSATERIKRTVQQLATLSASVTPSVPKTLTVEPLLRWTFDGSPTDAATSVGGMLAGGARIDAGKLTLPDTKSVYKSAPIAKMLTEKTLETWVTLDRLQQRGGSAFTIQTLNGVTFDGIVFGERVPNRWMAGSNGFARTQDVVTADEIAADILPVQLVVTYAANGDVTLYRNGKLIGGPYRPSAAPQSFDPNGWQAVFGLRHDGSNTYLQGAIDEARLYDRALTAAEVESTYRTPPPGSLVEPTITVGSHSDQKKLVAVWKSLSDMLAARARNQAHTVSADRVYAATSTKAGPTFLLARGDVNAPKQEVYAGAVSSIGTLPALFDIPSNATDTDRRKALAAWMTDKRNPLTARVMVNRIWQWHFGTGIVSTPNDFGNTGEPPTNPKLLDWLAATFQSDNRYGKAWSIKKMHRLILTSQTYRQASTSNPSAKKIDADNRLLWRFSPRRVEAEVIRDSMLAVAGNLNTTMGGPSFRPFTVSSYGSKFYALVDRDTPEFNRRSIYRMTVHSARNPLLEALDCPDPSSKTPKRNVSTTPTQALEMMNDAFVLRQARILAERVRKSAGTDSTKQCSTAVGLTLCRKPSQNEQSKAASFLKTNTLEMYCWALLNSGEFAYVD